jgi:hypothetical protein
VIQKRRAVLTLLLALAIPSSALAQPPQFTVELLQAPSEGGVAYDVNDLGVVVGHIHNNGTYAVVWNGKKMTELAWVATPAFGQGGRPVGINRSGTGFFNSTPNGFVFNSKMLGTGFTTIANAALSGINDASQLVGTSNGTATIWDGSAVRQLGASSAGLGINESGVATGFADLGDATAIRWQSDGDVSRVEILSTPADGEASAGYAIDDFGNVVGISEVNGVNRAVAWFGSTPTALSLLANTTSSIAWDLNIDQWIVGESASATSRHATLWIAGSPHALSDLIVGTNPFQRLIAAFGINDRGEIVGVGLVNGVEQPFILRPRKGRGH